ncbi:hypothetical protein [Bradyrhizobium sp. OHSU_III]|jgi:hypothetical protein|uniref:hypothetical protein n=1 Tax=Bradyrhizobium sp. OHSU_III TaxID=1297865 RepID=UPI000401EA92|nr:hypothetical protein [Bradyrhizobium sp. OHSU_III]
MTDDLASTAEPKPKAAGRKKRRRAPREEFVDYIVEIDGWDWGYSLSLNTMPREADSYNEFRHLQITGKLLRPAGLKTDIVEVSLLPSADVSEERRKDYKPPALGGLEAYPDRIDGHVGILQEALPPILQMLIAGQFRFMLLLGSKFRYRSARPHSLRLEMKLTEDDMPDDSAARSNRRRAARPQGSAAYSDLRIRPLPPHFLQRPG